MRLSKFYFPFVMLLLVTLGISEPLADFFARVAGKRNFVVDVDMVFHVRDKDGEFIKPNPEARFLLVIRNMEDYYFRLEKPDVFSGIEFVYFSRSERLYSGFNGKYTMDVMAVSQDYIVNTVKDVLDSLKEPLFAVEKKTSGDITVYNFKYTQVMRFIIRRLQIEPIRMEIFVDRRKISLKKIRLLGSDDEYVDMNVIRLETPQSVDEYFKSVQEF